MVQRAGKIVAKHQLQKIAEGIFVVQNFLTEEACAAQILDAEKIGFESADVDIGGGKRRLMNNIRDNERVDFISQALADRLFLELSQCALPQNEDLHAEGLSKFFRVYKYLPNQKFNFHKDGVKVVDVLESHFTVLIYLNDNDDGGETVFRQSGLSVAPEEGKLLIFKHDLWHSGVRLGSGLKYVLRTDLLFKNKNN